MYSEGWTEMGHILISYSHISAKLEHIYPEKQQNISKKDNGPRQMEGGDASRGNAG